ncbi:Fe-S cluster assembly ATPase SufC [SAR202 cluster bacterium AC-647-N09_OGT_505m]|nr:Fe-S cluster assembly ATPase SufC [SAR202 cluster bacterium AC-647-N09_OGT_505m]
MLEIRELYASIGDVEILKGVNLHVKAGEVHAIMGPNGSGKSTMANVLAGHPSYAVTSGDLIFDGADLLPMLPEHRARAGLFLCFQHPTEVPGVRLDHFMRAGFNSIQRSNGLDEMDVLKFDRFLNEKVGIVDMDRNLTKRSVNEGFSGGEKKRNEILQMAVFEPKLAILDEPDSGLDVDALRVVAEGINQLRSPGKALILVTHYQRILNYVVPDRVHVLINGRIVKSGDKDLAIEIEAQGYDHLENAAESPKSSR